MRNLGLILTMASMAVFVMASPAFASGGFVFKEHGFFILDFLVLFLLLAHFIKKPAKDFLLRRHEAVKLEMNEAMALKSQAENRVQRYEGLLSTLDNEVDKLREDFKQDGARIEADIRQQNEMSAERIRLDNTRSLARETAQMKTDIETDLIVRALDRAEVLVSEQMNDAKQKALLEDFIQSLEKRDNLDSTAVRA
jgi:F-type H+-transporting ATPase subunit b